MRRSRRGAYSLCRRTPGELIGSPMNSTPASSSAALTRSRVPLREGGIPEMDSKRWTVRRVTLARWARSSAVIPRRLLAARICAAEIN